MNLKTLFPALLFVLFLSSCKAPEPGIERFNLSNGVRVILQEDHSAGIIAIQVFIENSKLLEHEHNMGISALAASVWPKGTKNMSSREISAAFDSMGARFGVSVQPDFTAFSLMTLPSGFIEAFDLFLEVLFFPSFPDEELEREKSQQLSAIRRRQDNLFEFTYGAFREIFYPGHRYGFPSLGEKNTIKQISRADIEEHFKNLMLPENMVIAAAGFFRKEEMKSLLAVGFSGIAGESQKQTFTQREEVSGPAEARINIDSHSGWLIVGFPAPDALSEDYAAMKVLNSALGSGMSSRLFVEIREKQGLAYSVGSFYPTRTGPSHLAVYAVLEAGLIESARESILKQIEDLKTVELSAGEISRAKNFLRGSHLLGQETFSARAWNLAWFELMGRGYEYTFEYLEEINRVTPGDVRLAALKYLDNPSVVLVGPGVKDL